MVMTERMRRRAAQLCGERRVVLVDIENVLGGSVQSAADAEWARAAVREVVGWRAADQIVVGSGPAGLIAAADGWQGPRFVMGKGLNGADHALLDVMAEGLELRFAEVVLVSGDGIFAEPIAALGSLGVPVTVVAHLDALSGRLRMAATRVVHLPPPRGATPPTSPQVRALRSAPLPAIGKLPTTLDMEVA